MPDFCSRRGVLAGLCASFLLSGCAATPPPTLSAPDQADLARIQAALDRLHGLEAAFIGRTSDGARSTGTVWYDPGRLRLDYATPQTLRVVANGAHLVAHRDSDGSTTRIALSGNPLGLLLTQPLRLSGAIRVTAIGRAPGVLQVSLARTANPAQGLLTLVFDDPPGGVLGLRGLEAVDARGGRSRFDLFNVRTGLDFAPGWFDPPQS